MLDLELISMISVGGMLIGAVFMLAFDKTDFRYRRAVMVFALCGAMFLFSYFQLHPDYFEEISLQLAGALVGLILFVIGILKKRK